VIVGIGIKPSTEFIGDLELNSDGSINVNKFLRVTDDVYAVGDIASYLDARTNKRFRIEHWRTAQQQGRVAAKNMLGANEPFTGVPFFWSKLAGLNLVYVGHTLKWDDIIYWGNASENQFIAYYIDDNKVAAVLGCGRNKEMAIIEELYKLDKMPKPQDLKNKSLNLFELLRKYQS